MQILGGYLERAAMRLFVGGRRRLSMVTCIVLNYQSSMV